MNNIVDRIADGRATLLGVDDICKRLGISRTTFDRWVKNGTTIHNNAKARVPLNMLLVDAININDVNDESALTFPAPDIRIGNSPKWELETFKRWLQKNVK
jgi:predicted DNA-binding transcriptional regulator AlpA